MSKLTYPYNILSVIFSYKDGIEPADNFDEWFKNIHNNYSQFSEKDINILTLYYKDGLTFCAIGKEYGVTGARIRQIVAKNTRKLHHPSITKNVPIKEINNA